MYNFVIISLSRFNIELGSNIRDIAIELSKNHRVVYLDVPLKRKERWFKKRLDSVVEVKQRLRQKQSFIKINENLWHFIDDSILESINAISNKKIFNLLNWINNRKLARSISKAVAVVGFDNYILINDNEIYNGLHLKYIVKPKLYIYYLRDYLPAMHFWKKHASRLEPLLIGSADLVMANSIYLAEYAMQFNSKSYYVGQGCETKHFLPSRIDIDLPTELINIPRPLIGYIGALNAERLDIQTIEYLAMNMPHCSFVLIGKEDTVFEHSKLHQHRNIYFLGKKEFADLPMYLHSFDVAINPQAMNEITAGNYPRKIDEYLAAGKPVVATYTKTMEAFKEHVYLPKNSAEFKQCIEIALAENNVVKQETRIKFAQLHTWENSVTEMLNIIDKEYHG